MERSVPVDFVHPFFGMFRQAVRGILCFRGDMISEEIRFVDIAVVPFSREALFVKFVCSILC